MKIKENRWSAFQLKLKWLLSREKGSKSNAGGGGALATREKNKIEIQTDIH